MLRKFILASGLVAVAALAPATVSAGAQAPLAGPAADSASIVQQAQFWDIGRCRGWRLECADRWGWGTGRYHRCLARHGCERYRY